MDLNKTHNKDCQGKWKTDMNSDKKQEKDCQQKLSIISCPVIEDQEETMW